MRLHWHFRLQLSGAAPCAGLARQTHGVYDTGQMLALPHIDVLDALGCDVVIVESDGITNVFDQPDRWQKL